MNINDLFTLFNNFGYFGILGISFIGSIIVFVPVPYFPILITSALDKHLDPNIISISSAAGAVIAKMIIFYASYYGRKVLSDTTRKRMLPLQKLLSRYGWPGAFIAALTPIPDDLVYIPLGLAKYNPWKFATATITGKFILNEIIVWSTAFLGRPFVERVASNNIDPRYAIVGTIASIIILGIIVYLSLKIDWAKLIGRWFPWALSEDGPDKNKKTN
jgi:membrane protein DedA with SNARE-associated domain